MFSRMIWRKIFQTYKYACIIAFAVISLCFYSPLYAASKKKPTTNFFYTLNGLDTKSDKHLLDNAQERLKVLVGNKTYNRRGARQTYRAGKKEIKKALQPFGYYRARVRGALAYQNAAWRATYTINKDAPLKITRFKLLIIGPGSHNKKLRTALKNIPLKQGAILKVPEYQKSKISLINTARDEGYINARFTTDDVTVNLVHYQADILMVLNTGPRYYFGPVNFNQTPFNPSFLKRFLNFKSGQPFSPNTLSDLQSIYSGTGYFRAVTITPNIPEQNSGKNTVPVNVKFDMNKKHLYQIGVGYGTVTGIRLTGNIVWRWVNSRGDKFKLGGIWSSNYYDLNAQYLIPAKNPATSYYTLNAAAYIMEPAHGGRAYVAKAGPGYLWQKNRWTFQTRLYLLYEKWRTNRDEDFTYSHLTMPRFDALWVSTNNTVLVENGAKFLFVLSGAWRSIFSTATYLQPQVNFKGIKTLGKNNRFILDLQTGFTLGGDYPNVPLSEKFYAGGPNSILGFDYLGIGPGRYLTVANLQYQRRIYKQFYAGVFYNVGNAFNEFGRYIHNLNRTAGLTIVWRTPVGDLTLYWARVLSKPNHPNQFGFSLGPEL